MCPRKIETFARCADLPLIDKSGLDYSGDRSVDINIRQESDSVLAAQFQRDAGQFASSALLPIEMPVGTDPVKLTLSVPG